MRTGLVSVLLLSAVLIAPASLSWTNSGSLYDRFIDSATLLSGVEAADAQPESAPAKTLGHTVSVDVKATYLHTYADPAANPTIVDLAAAGFTPGKIIILQYSGWFDAWGYPNCTPPGFPLDQVEVLGVFSQSSTLLATSELYRIPGAIDAGTDFITLPTWNGNQPTDIPQDFRIFPPSPTAEDPIGFQIQIPPTAKYLFLGMHDRMFFDNCGEITVTIQPAYGSIGGVAWYDTNGNGTYEAAEPGLVNVLIELYKSGVQIGSTRTSGDGWFSFVELPLGAYSVRESHPTWVRFSSTADQVLVSVTAGHQNEVNFGDWDGLSAWLPLVSR